MKKKMLLLTLLLLPIFMFGCSAKIDLMEHMSEITKIYFYGENELFSSSISVGEREKDYIIDGKSGENTDFSLINLKFSSSLDKDQIDVQVIVNGTAEDIVLYFNPISSVYMNDLGYALNESDKVEISYGTSIIEFKVENFEISFEEALLLAKETLKTEINQNIHNGELGGECYLKVLTSNQSEKEKFWLFTLVNLKDEQFNILINVKTGQIIRV